MAASGSVVTITMTAPVDSMEGFGKGEGLGCEGGAADWPRMVVLGRAGALRSQVRRARRRRQAHGIVSRIRLRRVAVTGAESPANSRHGGRKCAQPDGRTGARE